MSMGVIIYLPTVCACAKDWTVSLPPAQSQANHKPDKQHYDRKSRGVAWPDIYIPSTLKLDHCLCISRCSSMCSGLDMGGRRYRRGATECRTVSNHRSSALACSRPSCAPGELQFRARITQSIPSQRRDRVRSWTALVGHNGQPPNLSGGG